MRRIIILHVSCTQHSATSRCNRIMIIIIIITTTMNRLELVSFVPFPVRRCNQAGAIFDESAQRQMQYAAMCVASLQTRTVIIKSQKWHREVRSYIPCVLIFAWNPESARGGEERGERVKNGREKFACIRIKFMRGE